MSRHKAWHFSGISGVRELPCLTGRGLIAPPHGGTRKNSAGEIRRCHDPAVIWLFFLLIALPVAEIGLLIAIGRNIGVAATVALLLLTGLLGAFLARRQGLEVVRKVQSDVAARRAPAGQLVDGALILLAGVLLIIPGVLTDALGFFCLLPAGRRVLKAWLRRRFEVGLRSGRIAVSVNMKNVTPRQRSPETKALDSGDEP